MSPSSVLLVFLQLCCLQMMLLSRPLCKLPGLVVQDAHNQLRDLGEEFPVQCRQYNDKIIFPEPVFSEGSANHRQCRWTSLVVYESLRGAELIFEKYELPTGEGGVTWDEEKLETYQNLQDRLVKDHQCLNTTEASNVLSPYFSNVTAVVTQQDSAACGWESLRRDMLWVLKSAIYRHRGCLNWTKAH